MGQPTQPPQSRGTAAHTLVAPRAEHPAEQRQREDMHRQRLRILCCTAESMALRDIPAGRAQPAAHDGELRRLRTAAQLLSHS